MPENLNPGGQIVIAVIEEITKDFTCYYFFYSQETVFSLPSYY